MTSLAEALPSEIKRVTAKKERWQSMMSDHDMGPGMQFSINIMQAEIDRGIDALAGGNVIEMTSAYEALKDYDDND